jgi:PIN domain nuclease of toxin-antitoxin system
MGRAQVTVAPVLDTHAWLWWIGRDTRLGAAAIESLDALPSTDRPYVSDISLWEVAMLVSQRRLELSEPLGDWLETASHPRTVRVVPISAAIAADTATLPRAVRDPADRIIVSTSRTLDAPLLTRDRDIVKSRLAKRWTPLA